MNLKVEKLLSVYQKENMRLSQENINLKAYVEQLEEEIAEKGEQVIESEE